MNQTSRIDRVLTLREIEFLEDLLKRKQNRKPKRGKKIEEITRLRCAIYARKSQEDTRDTSLNAQIEYCKILIDSCDLLELKEVYSEDNVSGMTDKRPEFQKMIANVVEGKIDVVVCYKMDRFARKAYITEMYEDLIRINNGCLLTGDNEIAIQNAQQKYFHQMLLLNNEYQARSSAEKTKDTFMNNLRKSGKYVTGKPPLGYQRGIDGKLEVNSDEALIIDEIYQSFLGGKSLTSIVCSLNTKGLKTREGKSFSKQAIHYILTNEVYTGTFIYNKNTGKINKRSLVYTKYDEIRIEDNHPSIIDKESFNKVQKILNNNAIIKINDSGYVYLLSGLVKCKQCGKMMIGNSQVSRS